MAGGGARREKSLCSSPSDLECKIWLSTDSSSRERRRWTLEQLYSSPSKGDGTDRSAGFALDTEPRSALQLGWTIEISALHAETQHQAVSVTDRGLRGYTLQSGYGSRKVVSRWLERGMRERCRTQAAERLPIPSAFLHCKRRSAEDCGNPRRAELMPAEVCAASTARSRAYDTKAIGIAGASVQSSERA